jgi:polyphosphate kinase 2 (PPK2 family)
MKRKQYEKEMRVLHGELVAMQEWVKTTGARVCIVWPY